MKRYRFFFIVFGLISFYASGQKDTVFIDEVVISSDRLSTLNPDGIRLVQIISRDQIDKLPVSTINDLLEYLTNTDLRKRGAADIQSDVSIRGGSFEQTLILLNGIRVNNPQTGHHNLDIPVELNQVDRIEILQGPGARLFGAGAFCGVINIVTTGSKESYIRLDAGAGMFGLFEGGVSANINSRKTNNFISVSGKKCSGYTTNTDYYTYKAFYSGRYSFNFGSFDFQAGYADKGFGANSFYSSKYPDQYEQTKSGFTSFKFSTGKKIYFSVAGYWQRHHDRFELFREEPPSWYKSHNYHLTDVKGAVINLQFHPKIGNTTVRAEFYNESISSNVLGNYSSDTISDPLDKDGFFTRFARRNNLSIAIGQSVTVKKFSFSIGALANYNDHFGFDICPGLDFSLPIASWATWYVAANKSFRIPTFTDLYYQGPVNSANPDLLAEKAYTLETGFKITSKGISSNIAGFYRYGKNIIDWVKAPDSLKWHSDNITCMDTWGAEFSLDVNFSAYNLRNNPLKNIKLAYTFLYADKKSGDMISYYLMDYLKHKLILDINAKIYKKTGISIVLNFSDRNGTYTEFSSGNEIDYRPYAVVDAKIYWHPLNFDIFLSCKNIFNAKYYDFGNIQMPGILISGGLSYTFNLKKIKNGSEK